MSLLKRWKLETFRHPDIHEARELVLILNGRGYVRVGFHDPVANMQYKTYAKVDFYGGKQQKLYCVEFMSYGEP